MTTATTLPEAIPNYGYDAPGVMRALLVAGFVLIAAGIAIVYRGRHHAILLILSAVLLVAGSITAFLGCCMVAYGFAGKMRMRDYMLSSLQWSGNEQVLDIGTGAGLLLIGAAKRLTTGHAIGIDLWSDKDLSNNTQAATERNIALEDVMGRATVQTGDATKLTFPDSTFDRVVSLLCLHNIEEKVQQVAACEEIARVLKPGGTALIGDYIPTAGYAKVFAAAGLRVTSSRSYFTTALGLMWMVVAEKPA